MAKRKVVEEVKEKKSKLSKLDQVTADLQKAYGNGTIMDLRNGAEPPIVSRFPVDSPRLGQIFGDGGLPQGRLIELFGPESSGKTSLACYCAGQIQKRKVNVIMPDGTKRTRQGQVIYIDVENSLDPEYALIQGFDVSKTILIQPDNGEMALDVAIAYAESGEVDLIVIDSIAALTPLAELEGEMGDQQIGLQARLVSKFLRKVTAIQKHNNCTIIAINQIRQKIGVVYGNPETTPGGNALKFYASLRLEIRKVEFITESTEVVGLRSRVKSLKNKTAPPMRKCMVDFYFDRGIDSTTEWLEFAVSSDVVKKSGSWFILPEGHNEGKKIQGLPSVANYYDEHPEEYAFVLAETKKRVFKRVDTEAEVTRVINEPSTGNTSRIKQEYDEDSGIIDSDGEYEEVGVQEEPDSEPETD